MIWFIIGLVLGGFVVGVLLYWAVCYAIGRGLN